MVLSMKIKGCSDIKKQLKGVIKSSKAQIAMSFLTRFAQSRLLYVFPSFLFSSKDDEF